MINCAWISLKEEINDVYLLVRVRFQPVGCHYLFATAAGFTFVAKLVKWTMYR